MGRPKPNRPFVKIDKSILSAGLTPFELAVYVALASFGTESQYEIHPGLAALASRANVSRRALTAALKSLKEKNLVRWTPGSAKTRTTNRYELVLDGHEVGQMAPYPRAGDALPVGQMAPYSRAGDALYQEPVPRYINQEGEFSSDDGGNRAREKEVADAIKEQIRSGRLLRAGLKTMPK